MPKGKIRASDYRAVPRRKHRKAVIGAGGWAVNTVKETSRLVSLRVCIAKISRGIVLTRNDD